MTSDSERLCLFCEEKLHGQRAKEHVFRKSWLKRLGHMKSPVHLSQWSKNLEVSKRFLAAGALQAGDICKGCNDGWMRQLDDDVQESIFNLVADQTCEIEISSAQREKMARWILKTAYAFKATDAPSRRHLRRETLENFWLDKDLPRGSVFFLGRDPDSQSSGVNIGHIDIWSCTNPEFLKLPQTHRMKFAVQYNSLILGCACIDHPDVQFRLGKPISRVILAKDCEVIEDDAVFVRLISSAHQMPPISGTALNVTLMAVEGRMTPTATCNAVNEKWRRALSR